MVFATVSEEELKRRISQLSPKESAAYQYLLTEKEAIQHQIETQKEQEEIRAALREYMTRNEREHLFRIELLKAVNVCEDPAL